MNNQVENYLRSFGMSGYLITGDLHGIESRYSLELGHTTTEGTSAEMSFHAQFEQSVRAEASDMASHYEMFYCLEKSIRKVITEAMVDAEGATWWDSGKIPPNIVEEVNKRMKKEEDSGVTQRSEDAIDYTTFGELSVIITSNWNVFETIFTSKRAVLNVMSQLNLLRGPIAHCSPMNDDEKDRLNLSVKDWFRLMA